MGKGHGNVIAHATTSPTLRISGIKSFKPMADFDWSWPTKIERDVIERALTLHFMDSALNLILVGRNGLGKTMIAQNICHAAVLAGCPWRIPNSLAKSGVWRVLVRLPGSAFSVAEELCRRVKRWREGDHRERWAGSALLLAESKFRRLKGYREIPQLVTALADHGIKKGLAVKARTA